MTFNEFYEKEKIIIEKIKKEIDGTFSSSLAVSDFSAIKETVFVHKDGNYRILIQFFKVDNIFVVYILLEVNKKIGDFYQLKTIKRIKLNINQETEIIRTVQSFKKEVDLKTLFKK